MMLGLKEEPPAEPPSKHTFYALYTAANNREHIQRDLSRGQEYWLYDYETMDLSSNWTDTDLQSDKKGFLWGERDENGRHLYLGVYQLSDTHFQEPDMLIMQSGMLSTSSRREGMCNTWYVGNVSLRWVERYPLYVNIAALLFPNLFMAHTKSSQTESNPQQASDVGVVRRDASGGQGIGYSNSLDNGDESITAEGLEDSPSHISQAQLNNQLTALRTVHLQEVALRPEELRLRIKIPRVLWKKWSLRGYEEVLSMKEGNDKLYIASVGLWVEFTYTDNNGKIFPCVRLRRSSNLEKIPYAGSPIDVFANRNEMLTGGYEQISYLPRGHKLDVELSPSDQAKGVMCLTVRQTEDSTDVVGTMDFSWFVEEGGV